MNKFIIDFNDHAPIAPRADTEMLNARADSSLVEYALRSISVVRPPVALAVDDYSWFYTVALSPQQWFRVTGSIDPDTEQMINKFNKSMINAVKRLSIDVHWTFEYNSDIEYIHCHGVVTNIKNMNQFRYFKKDLRKQLDIPSHNKIAIKFYQPTANKTPKEMLEYHLHGSKYKSNEKKSKPNENIYSITR
ncbi:MAG: hypothetical protein [Circular genetic element sp.]|nr:MAG: hypothetical protein [Circular genetic element sp.]